MNQSILSMRKFLMPEMVFGNGARKLAGQYCKNFNVKNVLFVSDENVLKTGLVKDVISSLNVHQIKHVLFSDVSPNPRDFQVMNGVDVYLKNQCDAIVAVGGGSPMDCAKGIGIVAQNGKNIVDYEGINKVSIPLPPLIFIPTTAGTASDISQISVIMNTRELVKFGILSKIIIPDIALIDSESTLSMDSYLTACTGMDALTHAIEAYVSIVSSPMTDLHAMKAIEIVSHFLPDTIKNPDNLPLREKIMFASTEAGLAFSNAILGAVHALSHSLGGYMDLPHGECNSLLLEHVVDYNFHYAEEKYKKVAQIMGLHIKGMTSKEIRKELFRSIQKLKKEVGITKTLTNIGVKSADIPVLAGKAFHDACLLTNPRKASKEDIKIIYEEAI